MAENNPEDMVEVLKKRGLSCARLKSLEKNKITDSKTFRTVGFNNLAEREEQSARDIKSLRDKVCKLR